MQEGIQDKMEPAIGVQEITLLGIVLWRLVRKETGTHHGLECSGTMGVVELTTFQKTAQVNQKKWGHKGRLHYIMWK